MKYHLSMRRLVSASVLLVLALGASSFAQNRSISPSVTSSAPMRGFTPGIPASITSQGSIGSVVGDPNFPRCCINPLFPINPNPPGFHRRGHGGFFPVPIYGGYYGGYGNTPVIVVQPGDQAEPYDEEDGGGPTIFDRRGPRRTYDSDRDSDRRAPRRDRDRSEDVDRDRRDDRNSDAHDMEATARPPQELAPAVQPKTVLVFRDGHQEEIRNYAIVGEHLFDFGETRRRIDLASLDVPATVKANDARGLDFSIPMESRPAR